MKNKRLKKYKCPYCELRSPRTDLVEHIDSEHQSFIPPEFTAARLVFNIANNKTEGKCIVCNKKAPWNETASRYDRLCGAKKCREEYAAKVNNSIVKVHGRSREDFLNDMDHQNKMLKGRAISGEYKFSDGGIRSYVGSYEKTLLEFMDNVLEISSKDILTPGPVIEYIFENDTLKWITDLYYIPYNLVFDVKHGGSNKNTHPGMAINNNKQIAKETAITKLGDFNYIRLTDNNFGQLIEIFMEMKENALNHIDDVSIKIFEGAMIGTFPTSIDDPRPYIVGYGNSDTNKTEGYGIIQNLLNPTIFVQQDDLKFITVDSTFFADKKATIYNIIDSEDDRYIDFMTKVKEGYIFDSEIHPVLSIFESDSIDTLILYEVLTPIYSFTNTMNYEDVLAEEFNTSNESYIGALFENTVLDTVSLNEITSKLYGYSDLIIDESYDGFVVKNMYTGIKSKKYKTIADIPAATLTLLNRGY